MSTLPSDASLCNNSLSARSVPCCLSMNGEMTARRKLENPTPAWRGRGELGRLELGGKLDIGQPKKNAQQQPQISVQDEIFIRLNAGKSGRKKQEKRIPKNYEAKRKPGGTFQLL